MSPLKPLSDRIEEGIRERAIERVEAAIVSARLVALPAYADALRPACGRPFDVIVAGILREAETKIADAARAEAVRIETDNVLKRLSSA